MPSATVTTIPLYSDTAERDSELNWTEGALAYVAGEGYSYFDGAQWQPVAAGYHAPLHFVDNAPQAVAATANVDTYAPLLRPLVGDVALDVARDVLCLCVLAAFVDIGVNNAEVALALDIAGAINSPAGSVPENRLHVIAKQPVAVTLSDSTHAILGPGTSRVELQHAGDACTVSDVSLTIIPLQVIPAAAVARA